MGRIRVVTIGRRYCAGGSDIGKMVAQKLGVKCYDREIVEMASERSGISMPEINKYEETLFNRFKTPITLFGEPELTLTEKIFEAEAEVILELVSKEDCVIVGRCADYILKNKVRTMNVFLTASHEKRTQVAMDKHHVPYEAVDARLKKYDHKRARYYSVNTKKEWDSMDSYDMCLDSGKLGYELCAEIIANSVKVTRTDK